MTQVRSQRPPTKSFPVHYSLRIPSTLHKVVQKSCDMGGNKLNFQVTSVTFSIISATDSDKVKFTLEQDWKTQRGNNVSCTLSLTSNNNLKQNIPLSFHPCQLLRVNFLPSTKTTAVVVIIFMCICWVLRSDLSTFLMNL